LIDFSAVTWHIYKTLYLNKYKLYCNKTTSW